MESLQKEDWLTYLNLKPHPEGGWFSEIYRNHELISDTELTTKYSGKRNLATSIYFMLANGNISKLHRLKSDELWYFHYGSQLTVHIFLKGEYKIITMGTDIGKKQQLQLLIPAGAIFGAEVLETGGYTVLGCMVTPGFHFDDFELVPYNRIIEEYSVYSDLIKKLT
jgi:predicted cupin superfamily sugar epimerase